MTKGGAEKSTYLLLFSKRLNKPLAPPILKKGSVAHFNIPIPFIPRLCGYSGSKVPKPDDVFIYFVERQANGEFGTRKKMGQYDFATVDLDDVLPSLEIAKLGPVDSSEEEEAAAAVVGGSASSDEDDSDEESSSSSSSEEDNPKDANYKEMSVSDRIAACADDTIYWSPSMHWQFRFPLLRDPPHLQCSQVKFTMVKKHKA